jgi:hypothetical protein
MKNFRRFELRTQNYLSHYPRFYALIVGIGIVLFWRGVWHSADHIHTIINYLNSDSSMALYLASWWDGPLSFIIGITILYVTGAFTSSFIGNELILSGLRGEKRLNERTEADLKDEVSAISDIKEELMEISKKLEILEKRADNNHKSL